MESKGEPRTKVKLMKMSKGYQWEISVNDVDDANVCVDEVHATDKKLRELYPDEVK